MNSRCWFAFTVLALFASCGSHSEEEAPAPSERSASKPSTSVKVDPAPAASGEAPGTGAEQGTPATIHGVVKFEGEPPAREQLAIAGTAGCQHEGPPPLSETVIVNDGRLQNCIVFVSKVPKNYEPPPPPTEPLRMDQQGCVYRPHVVAVRAGQKLLVHNGDPTSHNVHVYSNRTTVPNRTQPAGGQDLEIVFAKAEPPVQVGCDIHPWMRAWVGVFEHPFFAVTGVDGTFRIEGLPLGEYTLTCWHEKYGKQTVDVELPAGATAEIGFAYPD